MHTNVSFKAPRRQGRRACFRPRSTGRSRVCSPFLPHEAKLPAPAASPRPRPARVPHEGRSRWANRAIGKTGLPELSVGTGHRGTRRRKAATAGTLRPLTIPPPATSRGLKKSPAGNGEMWVEAPSWYGCAFPAQTTQRERIALPDSPGTQTRCYSSRTLYLTFGQTSNSATGNLTESCRLR